MNQYESRVVEHLKMIQSQFGVTAVKSEFEAQGMELNELIRLKMIASSAGLGIVLKVGGAEDVWGVKQALLVGVSGVIFPMVESSYALSKSLSCVRDYVSMAERTKMHVAVNIETELAVKNLEAILREGKQGGLDAVTLGRVDLIGSLGLSRAEVNSEGVYDIARKVCYSAKEAGLVMTIGGNIEVDSHNFVKTLYGQGVLDSFETRMIVFPAAVASDYSRYKEAVRVAHQFELFWLEAMNYHHGSLMERNQIRLQMLRKRVE